MATQDFAGAEQALSPVVATMISSDKLAAEWKQVEAKAGAMGACDAPVRRPAKPGEPTVIVVPCQFANAALDIRITFDESLRVTSFFLKPGRPHIPWTAPPYAAADAHTRELPVGDLGGTLTMPGGAGPFPCVVLVHGSGPNDRDETLGANKVFADLAAGLAAHGVATLRYDKRTLVAPETLPLDGTVEDESIKDAVSATELCAAQPAIDRKRVYVLGHSLGAFLAPRIAKQAKDVAGIIILAGPTRDFEQIHVEQLTYLANIDGTISPAEQTRIDKAKAEAKRVHELQAGAPPTPGERPDRLSPAYWKDLGTYDATAVAASLSLPIFVGQGGRDYQVSAKLDFPGWQKALAKRPHTKLVVWPKLNHQLIAGEGPSTPAEYMKPAHVDEQVIKDLADFIAAK